MNQQKEAKEGKRGKFDNKHTQNTTNGEQGGGIVAQKYYKLSSRTFVIAICFVPHSVFCVSYNMND